MSGALVADEILAWALKQPAWRQDALRRIACSNTLTAADEDDLLAMVQQAAGLSPKKKPPVPNPIGKSHLATGVSKAPLSLKEIRNIKNVNHLATQARLEFHPIGLTIVYGPNGSGKSGFVRIFRTACRSRIEYPKKLKILGDVYGKNASAPQEAEIVISDGSSDIVLAWKAGDLALAQLSQIAVFDSLAASLYVDEGNQIKFLPFGLSIPYRLNDLCLALKTRIETERSSIHAQIALLQVTFPVQRLSKAQIYYGLLDGTVVDIALEKAVEFSKADGERLDALIVLLSAQEASAADLISLADWLTRLAEESKKIADALTDAKLKYYQDLSNEATAARTASNSSAKVLFGGEPLMGVGGDTWMRFWEAARAYSSAVAYPGIPFPVTTVGMDPAHCVLCQQPLESAAAKRLQQFEDFVSGNLASKADAAEAALAAALNGLPAIDLLVSKDWAPKLYQIGLRVPSLRTELETLASVVLNRLTAARQRLGGSQEAAGINPQAQIVLPDEGIAELAKRLSQDAGSIAAAKTEEERSKLLNERNELEDQRILSNAVAILAKRRDLLKQDARYAAALAEVGTMAITKKANELVEVHLTQSVADRFDAERKSLRIDNLKISLKRKSDQRKPTFQTNSGTTLTKNTSEILSEGEQRALALSAFFTEIAVSDGTGPIVIDDPVSSLDRERGLKVANRLAHEAIKRQVIVFTHDLIFFNDLYREALTCGVEPKTAALFSTGNGAGNTDPSGVPWRGLPVDKRIKQIRAEFPAVKSLHSSSPADYEYRIKGLYGQLRHTYERLVEEHIFSGVVQRGSDVIETLKLRYVHLSDPLAVRFHEGMTKANTYSHDNPASGTVATPLPAEFEADLDYIQSLVIDLVAESKTTEANRPSMKPKK